MIKESREERGKATPKKEMVCTTGSAIGAEVLEFGGEREGSRTSVALC